MAFFGKFQFFTSHWKYISTMIRQLRAMRALTGGRIHYTENSVGVYRVVMQFENIHPIPGWIWIMAVVLYMILVPNMTEIHSDIS